MPLATLADYQAAHFKWRVTDGVGFIELHRPERKNPLTFDSYAELRDLFRAMAYAREGQFDEAEALAKGAVAISQHMQPPQPGMFTAQLQQILQMKQAAQLTSASKQ